MPKKVQPAGKLHDITIEIKKTITDIAHKFNSIGYLLWEVREYKYFEERGYKDVFEYAEKELMLRKSSTYNFINISERFSLKTNDGKPTPVLADDYERYNYTQLTEMLSIKAVNPTEVIKPEMTKTEVREVKKKLKEQLKKDVENAVDTEFKQVAGQIDMFDEVQPVVVKKYDVQCITKDKLISYMEKRIENMKRLSESESTNITSEMKFKCLGQIEAFDSLIDLLNRDFKGIILD